MSLIWFLTVWITRVSFPLPCSTPLKFCFRFLRRGTTFQFVLQKSFSFLKNEEIQKKSVWQNSSRLIKLFLQHRRSHLVCVEKSRRAKCQKAPVSKKKRLGPACCACVSTARWRNLTCGGLRALYIKMYFCHKYCIKAMWKGQIQPDFLFEPENHMSQTKRS